MFNTFGNFKSIVQSYYSTGDLYNILAAGDLSNMKATTVTTFGASTIANWHYNNALVDYYFAAVKTSVTAVSNWQTANTTGYSKEEYFGKVKNYFGQFSYDQLLQQFLSSSTSYTDSFLLNEWHLYGSSRIGIRKANVPLAFLKFNSAIDANGNILTQKRNGGTSQTNMDDLAYDYYSGTNKLKQVHDNVTASNYPDDIDNQSSTTNYNYDELGNLIQDSSEQISSIEWNIYGKISRITRATGSTKPDLEFAYTPDGHRSVKIVKPKSEGAKPIYTYYVRDAQGNILATYTRIYQRTIDFDMLAYSNVNNEIISHTGSHGYAGFIATQHLNNPVTGLNSALETSLNSSSTISSAFLKEINPFDLLSSNSTLADNTIINISNHVFFESIQNLSGLEMQQLCNCADARNIADNSYPTLLQSIVSNNVQRDEFFTYIYNNDPTSFSTILTNLGGACQLISVCL